MKNLRAPVLSALLGLVLASATLADHKSHWPQRPFSDHVDAPGGITDLDYHAFYVRAEGGGVERLNAADGKRVWHVPSARQPVALVGELLIAVEGAGDADGGTRLLGISREDGAIRWTSNDLGFIGVSRVTQSELLARVDGSTVIVHIHASPRHDLFGSIVAPGSPSWSHFFELNPKTGRCTPAPSLEARWVELAVAPEPRPPETPVRGFDGKKLSTPWPVPNGERFYVFDAEDEILWFKTAPAGGKVTGGPITLHTQPAATSRGWGFSPSLDWRHFRLTWHADGERGVALFDTATARRILTGVDLSKLEEGVFLAHGKRIWRTESPEADDRNRAVPGQAYWVRPANIVCTDLKLAELWRRPIYGRQEFEAHRR